LQNGRGRDFFAIAPADILSKTKAGAKPRLAAAKTKAGAAAKKIGFIKMFVVLSINQKDYGLSIILKSEMNSPRGKKYVFTFYRQHRQNLARSDLVGLIQRFRQ